MHGSAGDRRALEREALRNVIAQWNANRLDIFELSEPNEDLEFHGVMRFYFQDSGQKVATKCIRVASDATVEDVIGTLVEKFRPDMRMLSVPSYALYELHEHYPERKMAPDEKPLLVQLNWHVDDREGRFLLKNVDDKTVHSVGLVDSNASFRRKLSKREKKQLKKQEKLSRLRSENGTTGKDGVAEKLYTELPETSFTRSISNPEAVMRRRRQQKLERKLQQFRSKDGGPDTGGTLKIYGEALCKDVPYKTLLLSIRDCAGSVVREMLEKYGLSKTDPSQWCLVQVTQQSGGGQDTEYVLDDDECPLSILMNAPGSSSIMFHVRRRPADCAPRKRKKKPGALGANATNPRDPRGDAVPILVELGPDGSAPLPGDTARTLRLNNDVMEVGSANGIALQLYGPHIQPRHCVITNTDGVTSLTPCHADAHTYVNGQRIHQTTILTHGSLVKFGHSNTYRFLDPSQEDRSRHPAIVDSSRIYDRSPRALSPTEPNRENFETTFDLEGNVETVSTASGAREDNRSLGSSSENRLSGIDRYPRGQDPILPAVLEFPEDPQELFLARVITHLEVTTPTFRLAPAYTLYLCARYRASTHYRPELTPTERAQKLTLLLQHAAKLIRHTVQDRSTESISQAFWLANASELLNFLKSDRHVSAFSLQAQDTLADSVQLAFRNLVACLTDELNSVMNNLMSDTADDHPREIISVLSNAMHLLRKCRVNAALTIQLFSQLFHWISARSLSTIINNSQLCTRNFGIKLFNRLRNLQAWAESQGLELAAECHLAKIVQCAHLLQAPKYTADELAKLSAACFKLNSLQLRALLTQYKGEPGEQVAPPPLLEHAARAAEGVADELARAEGREVKLHEDSAPPLQLLLPDDGFSCDVVQGVPPGLADFLHPLQASGLCRLAAQPTSSGHWTVYMSAPRPPSALSTTQPEVQVIRLHKAGGGMGLSIVAAKGAGQERLGIYIKSVVPGGAADRDGRLAAGDQLLSVDGQSLLGITQEKAAEFLVRTGSIVTLEVAKGGAVYHGLATLLQQPSPTPHRAMDSPDFYRIHSSQDSLYGAERCRMYTPPVTKPKNNVFFNSDDSLYKTEVRKLTIPRIEIECEPEPEFKLQITDFSEPNPKDVTHEYEEDFKPLGDLYECQVPMAKTMKSWKSKSNNFMQQKSYSLDVKDIPFIDVESCSDTEAYLTICNNSKKLKQMSTSLQDLSSSTSSVNSGIHDSNLDLSQIDTPVKQKNWKSPDEIRHGHVKYLAKHFEYVSGDKKNISCTASVPNLNSHGDSFTYKQNQQRSKSTHNLNKKLTDYERETLLKLLQDWSIKGSDGINPENVKRENGTEIAEECNDSSLLKKFILQDNVSIIHDSEVNLLKESNLNDETQNLERKLFHRSLSLGGNLKTQMENKSDIGLKKYFNKSESLQALEFILKPEKSFSSCDANPENFKRSCKLCLQGNLFSDGTYNKDQNRSLKRNLNSEEYSKYFKSNLQKSNKQFFSEPDLSPRTRMKMEENNVIFVAKYNSENNLNLNRNIDADIMHCCKYRNCIFNVKYFGEAGPKSTFIKDDKNLGVKQPSISETSYEDNSNNKHCDQDKFYDQNVATSSENIENNCNIGNTNKKLTESKKLKGILKNSNEKLNVDFLLKEPIKRGPKHRRFSEVLESAQPFNYQLVRCGSLERFTSAQMKNKNFSLKKFPDAYIVTKRNSTWRSPANKSSCEDSPTCNKVNGNENISIVSTNGIRKTPKVIVLKKKYYPKAWKSCSDIKSRERIIRKCCRNARTTCPVLKKEMELKSKTQSCADFSASAATYIGLKYAESNSFDRPRRMSERDLPSRVDAERTIPSSKSVPALHHISPGSEQPRGNTHDVFNPGYSRTSSNNSINTNSAATPTTQNGPVTNQGNLRSRSTHNLHQQDAGFYQNLSVYRNKMPSPQQLGDRTSALRSSQNSLQSQRPSSAYYPNPAGPSSAGRLPLHQSIPNLKSPQSIQRLHAEETRSGSFPTVNQQIQQSYNPNSTYSGPNANYPPPNQTYQNYGTRKENYERQNQYVGENQNYTNANYPRSHEENKQYPAYGAQRNEGSFPSPNVNSQNYQGNLQQPLHINANGQRTDDRIQDARYNTGLLREDYRHSQAPRAEELIRYSSTNNIRIQDAQVQQSKPQEVGRQEDFNRSNEMRTSKSEDVLRQYANSQNEMFRYASSGNIKAQEKLEMQQRRDAYQSKMNNDERKEEMRPNNLRGQAKLAEMGEEVRRRQNRTLPNQQFHSPSTGYYQHPPQYGQQGQGQPYASPQQNYPSTHILMAQNTQSMQNLSLAQNQNYPSQTYSNQQTPYPNQNPAYQNQSSSGYQNQNQPFGGQNQNYPQPNVTSPGYQQNNYYNNQNTPTSPGYPKSPPIAPKPLKKPEDPPDPPPTTTHPLYSASSQDPPKMSLYPNSNVGAKTTRDPWAREEQERQSEKRREQVMMLREQQILELSSMPNRNQQQEEHLRVLQLEREFQKRAMEEPEQDEDDDTEKLELLQESPVPYASPQPVSSATVTTTINSSISTKQEPPMSILKPGANPTNNITSNQAPPPPEPQAPPPPERGSSYTVMSLRNKEGTKRVSFNDTSASTPPQQQQQQQQPPNNLQLEEIVREDPNSFIRQAESMLASPTTPTDASANLTATPGVIGAQEVYRDPRTRRLAEQAQQKSQAPIPEKLSFKEKMKMFAMETGEAGTPKDKSKISRAQREIDNLGSPNPNLVH